MTHKLAEILDRSTNVKLAGGSLLAVLFLSAYNRQICPFINGLHLWELLGNLFGLMGLQLAFRHWLFYTARPNPKRSLARQGYQRSVVSWMVAGVAASLLHYLRYPSFPASSHLKLLSSYWVLGAGILAQWEYVILEQAERRYVKPQASQGPFLEQVSHRIVEGYVLFTAGPVIFMLLVVFRFQYEGYLEKGVALEVFYIGFFCVVAAIWVAYIYGKRLKEDTKAMIKGLRQIEQGDFEVRLDLRRADEFGELSEGVNHLAKGLSERERIKEAFGRFVDPQVARKFIETYIDGDNTLALGGEKRDVVILMSDIRDFTPLSESMPAEDLTQLLNGYFTVMVAAIQQHGGLVDKFMGDAVMAIFGLVDGGEQPAVSAVKAALDMQAGLAQYNQSLGTIPIRSGIGIHRGAVIAGYLGSVERMEFTVIGAPVNIAARIESHARGENPAILFSPVIAQQIAGEFEVTEVCTTSLKGVQEKITLFTVNS